MTLKEARIRVKAKGFKARIANGTCLQVPEDIIATLEGDDFEIFFQACKSIGLERIEKPSFLYGYWQKT